MSANRFPKGLDGRERDKDGEIRNSVVIPCLRRCVIRIRIREPEVRGELRDVIGAAEDPDLRGRGALGMPRESRGMGAPEETARRAATSPIPAPGSGSSPRH